MVSQARTAGRAFRVWRLQRSIDGDVDALSASKQQDLGRFLARTGGDGRRTYADLRAVDSDAADTLAAIDDPVTQRQFVNAYQRGEVDSDELATALKRYDELDADGEQFADEVIAQTGDDGPDLLLADVCNSPCEAVIRDVYQYTKRSGSDGLTNSEAKDLLNAYRYDDDIAVGPGSRRDVGDIQETLESLEDDGVDGTIKTMGEVSGDATGYKRIAGETDITDSVVNGYGKDPDAVEMSKDIDDPPASAPLDATEVDVDVEGEIKIDGETLDSPAIESKHLNPEGYNDFTAGQELGDLEEKLITQAAAGEDELVVVTTNEFKRAYQGRFDDLPTTVRQHPSVNSDVTVKVTTYEELGT